MADALEAVREGAKTIFKEHHETMRQIVRGLDADALNWRPGPVTNSLAVLTVHLLSAERACVSRVIKEPTERSRDAEFQAHAETDQELLDFIDEIDAALPPLIDRITAEDLAEERGGEHDWRGRVNPGIWWLLHGMRQGREHIGQMFLTKQLYEQQVLGKFE